MYFCTKVSLNMSKKGIVDFIRNHKQLVVIITAALLLELLSGTQYYYTHRMLERELEKRAESELRFKAVLIKSALNASEDLLKGHLWDIKRHLSKPDSMFAVTHRLAAVMWVAVSSHSFLITSHRKVVSLKHILVATKKDL